MEPTRREFIRAFGVTLAALLTSGCGLTRRLTPTPFITCYEMVEPTPTATLTCYTATPPPPPTPTLGKSSHWKTLRDCWLSLKNKQLQSYEETDFSRELRQRHAQALDALVASGELDAAVAQEIGLAFEQAIAHIQQQMATCYIALPPEFTPREDLVQQAAALTEMASQSKLEPATVAQAQAALERDIAWLSQFGAGQQPGELEIIQATPEEIEAARILVRLLLEQ